MRHRLAAELRERLSKAGDPVKAPAMQRYMKSAMPYRGVPMPRQRAIWREAFRQYPPGSPAEWRRVVMDLWRGAAYREERYAAIALAEAKPYASHLTWATIPMIEELIVTGAWWDHVDWLATHHLGTVLARERAAGRGPRMHNLLKRWARGPNLWKRRAAILSQIRFKKDTDLDLLYACIEPNLDERDFFIRKAIGWALRQYAWTNPDEVRRYVAANRDRLSPLSTREAMKNV